MKGRTLKFIIFFALISIVGILLIQIALLRSSYRFSEKQFRESCTIALKEVSYQLFQATGRKFNFDSIAPVHYISDEYYVVKTGISVDEKLLQFHLIEELRKHNIYISFEYAIFNRSKGRMEKSTFINEKSEVKKSTFRFPLHPKYTTYFAIHFPDRSNYFNTKLSVSYFLSGILFFVLIFFAYTLFVIFRQRQLSEIQKNFINNLTHELKTPISSISLSVNVLNDEKILENPQRYFEYVRIISEQNQRLANNVEKVLNLATIEKSKLQLNLKMIELESFLNNTIEQFKQSKHGSSSEILTQFPPKPVYFKADGFHLSNLISNILENAVKYCEKKPQIQIITVLKRTYFQLKFKDNGIGIPKSQRKKIFTKFYRVPTGNIHNVKGFGLGLDYVRKIVLAHDWKIKVTENPEGGSIFTVTIGL